MGEGSSWALFTGGGKDATLALRRARESGLDVGVGVTMHDGASGRVKYHGVPATLVADHLEALGMNAVLVATTADDYEDRFVETLASLRRRGVAGVVFGNIHLADVRAWYEERTTAAGLLHREPLWGEDPRELVREVVARGYRARVTGVDPERADRGWLGRILTTALLREMESRGVDPCGERGEYHTFVTAGPGFRRPVAVTPGGVRTLWEHRILELAPG